jgi:2-methylaconitate cis-trans-isomerase PrpF
MSQKAIRCWLYRAGTSKGAYFLTDDLPADVGARDRVLLAALGSPHPRQVDGIGGGDPLSSKVAIVGRSTRPDADVDFLFAQVSVDRACVDPSVSCGNMLAGVGPFAIEAGLVSARQPQTRVRVHAVNTGALVEAVVQTPHGVVRYDGEAAIDGVPGTAAPVRLNYLEAVGGRTGALLPTGSPRDTFEGLEATCIDAAVPLVILAAASLGKHGGETPGQLNADGELLARLERVRRSAALRMGLGSVEGKVEPKVALISPPAGGIGLRSRYFMPWQCHPAHAVNGAIGVACCGLLEGSVADGLARVRRLPQERVLVEHPSGALTIDLRTEGSGLGLRVREAGLLRTVRLLFQGKVFIPPSGWDARRLRSGQP